MSPRHFIDISDFRRNDLRHILDQARILKVQSEQKTLSIPYCKGAILLMIFEKPSTRTRVSFDVAMRQLEGSTIFLKHDDMQLGRGETIADTARVLSRYGNVILLRTSDHSNLTEFAEYSQIPVINGLTDYSHPCQIMADILTFEEKFGPIEGRSIAWIGDGNNVATSWIHAAARFGLSLRLACPKELMPEAKVLDWAKREGGEVMVTEDPKEAVDQADCVVTDVWLSMGQSDMERRQELLRPFQVNADLMSRAAKDAIFMHCLPAHRDWEVTADVIDGPQSVAFDEAENRLHIQKSILAWCLESI